MKGTINWLFVAGCLLIAGAIAAAVSLAEVVLRDEKSDHRNRFSFADMNITQLNLDPYQCAAKVDCRCEQTEAASCGHMVENLIGGSCGDGYHCCHYDNCGRVTRTCSGRGKRRSCRNRCHRTCEYSVGNRLCESFLYQCYTATIVAEYMPQEKDIEEATLERYDLCFKGAECTADGLDCTPCFHIVQQQGYISMRFTDVRESRQDARQFLTRATLGAIDKMYYNRDEMSQIYFDHPSFSMSVGAIVGFVFIACGGAFGFFLIAVGVPTDGFVKCTHVCCVRARKAGTVRDKMPCAPGDGAT